MSILAIVFSVAALLGNVLMVCMLRRQAWRGLARREWIARRASEFVQCP